MFNNKIKGQVSSKESGVPVKEQTINHEKNKAKAYQEKNKELVIVDPKQFLEQPINREKNLIERKNKRQICNSMLK